MINSNVDSDIVYIPQGLEFEEFEAIKSQLKPEITREQFCLMAGIAMDMGLIYCCAPYSIGAGRKYLVQNNKSGSVFLMTEETASYYLVAILEQEGVDPYVSPTKYDN